MNPGHLLDRKGQEEKPLVLHSVSDAPDELVFADEDENPHDTTSNPSSGGVAKESVVHQTQRRTSSLADGMSFALHRLENGPLNLDASWDEDDVNSAPVPSDVPGSIDGSHTVRASVFASHGIDTVIHHPSRGKPNLASQDLPALPFKAKIWSSKAPLSDDSSNKGGASSFHRRYPSANLVSHRSAAGPRFLDFSYGKSLHLLKSKLAAYASVSGKQGSHDPMAVTAMYLSNNLLGTGDLPFSMFSVFTNLETLNLSFNKLGPTLTGADFISRSQHRHRQRPEDPSSCATTKSSSPTSYSSSSRSTSQASVDHGSDAHVKPSPTLTLLQHFPNLGKLDLRSNRLSSLPPDLHMCKNLRELLLWKNELDDAGVPAESLASLTRLERLNLACNLLASIPASLTGKRVRFLALSVIDLSGNVIRDLPAEFLLNCPGLRSLLLARNHITQLPSSENWKGMGSLETLDLTGNLLSSIEPDLFAVTGEGFKRLERLDLGNNKLTHCPVFGAGTAAPPLVMLDLSGNSITSIDRSVFSLPMLETLVLELDDGEVNRGQGRFIKRDTAAMEGREFDVRQSLWIYPPADVVARGLKAMRDWVQASELGVTDMMNSERKEHYATISSNESSTDGTILQAVIPSIGKNTGARTVCEKSFTLPFSVMHKPAKAPDNKRLVETSGDDSNNSQSDTLVLRVDKYDVHVDVRVVASNANGRLDQVDIDVQRVCGVSEDRYGVEESRIGCMNVEVVARRIHLSSNAQ
ncbi:Podocan-like protein 1 [Gonapodya sp. JEL0774]|nr:Podocan-like protein 1 [Gonapodya sp. JEL0774]